METWKTSPEYPGYEFSSEGRVMREGELMVSKKPYPSYEIGGRCFSPTTILREFYTYEWIKHLQEGEEVKPLREYPGYFITSLGRVWSMKQYKFLSVRKQGEYYWRVNMGKNTSTLIHILVGRNFLPEYREGLLILHKEETLSYPEINYPENLWVGTYSDNQQDRRRKCR